MIFGHEGLPRSGKSYESLVEHILKALEQDRKVFTNVDGLNYEKLSELTSKPQRELIKLVHEFQEDELYRMHEVVDQDSLVVFDEVQNYYPSVREKLSKEITTFIAEHGHHGIDILLMTQSFADIHSSWRRRMAKKIVFTKLDMLGRPNHYKWVLYAGQFKAGRSEPVFTEVNSGTKKYEEKYFGAYKSHSEGTTITDNYEDKRGTIFADKKFKYGIPAVIGLALFCLYSLYSLFTGGDSIVSSEASASPKPKTQQATSKLVTNKTSAPTVATLQPLVEELPLEYYFMQMMNDYEPRIVGEMYMPSKPEKYEAFIEVTDDTYHVKDMFKVSELKKAGYNVIKTDYGLLVMFKDEKKLIRSTPIDYIGKVGKAQIRDMQRQHNDIAPTQTIAQAKPKSRPTPPDVPGITRTNPGAKGCKIMDKYGQCYAY